MQLVHAFIVVVGGAPLGYSSAQRPALTTRLRHPVCSFDGNADFYGLGIRIGIYLQWISSLLANRYVPDAIRNLLMTNTIFLLAVAIAGAQATAAGTLHKAEALVLQHLCFGFLFTILTIWGFRIRTAIQKSGATFSLAEKAFRLGLSAAICGYGVWFWFIGNYSLSVESCSTITFLFGKVDSLGSVHYFYKVQSVALLLLYGNLLIRQCFTWALVAAKSLIESLIPAAILALIDRFWGGTDRLKTILFRRWIQTGTLRFWLAVNGRMVSPEFSLPSAIYDFPVINSVILVCWITIQFWSLFVFGKAIPPEEPPLLQLNSQAFSSRLSSFKKYSKHIDCGNFLASFNLVCLLWGIAATECTLYWNQVPNVYSVSGTGQLIPLIIGIANFVQIAYTIILQKSQPILTYLLLNAIVASHKEPSHVPESDSNGIASADEPDRYYLSQRFAAIFWRNSPRRRHSVDILMPGVELSEMKLGVSMSDQEAMGIINTKRIATLRRHSCSGLSSEQFRIYNTHPIIVRSTKRDASEPTQTLVSKRESRFSTARSLALREICKMLFFYVVRTSKTFSEVKKDLVESVDDAEMDRVKGIALLRSFVVYFESRGKTWNLPPSPTYNTTGGGPIENDQDRTALPRRLGPGRSSWDTSRSSSADVLVSGSPQTSTAKPARRKWGPHLEYRPAHLPKPSVYPKGFLRTALRLLGTVASVSMPESPQISATAANFADMFSELGEIWAERRDGKISWEEQDELCKDWFEEFQKDYFTPFCKTVNSVDVSRNWDVLTGVFDAVLEREEQYRKWIGREYEGHGVQSGILR